MEVGMKNLEILLVSLEYIEKHLCDTIRVDAIASACFCSKSSLERLFRYVYGISIHDYIIRRRMTIAAKKLVELPKIPILDIALDVGYSTHESFARAFEQIWNCKPSEFRSRKYAALFPKFQTPMLEGDEYIMQSRHVDINELYDLLQDRKDCYFVCCDIKKLVPINEISKKAGDLAILEQMRRMTAVSGEEDAVFRIGGDEFCILTNSSQPDYAAEIVRKIIAMNGESFSYEDQSIPLNLYATAIKLDAGKCYDEVFADLHNAIRDCKSL